MAEREPPQPGRCAHCGDVLGVYEPIVLLRGDQPAVTTSLAGLGDAGEGRAILLHGRCHELREGDNEPDRAA